MGSRANKYLIAITDGYPALQDELTRNLISARREAEQPFQDHRMSYVLHGLLQFILARIDRVSGKGWVNQLPPMKRLPFGCICRGSANAGNRDGQGHPSTLLAKVLG